MHRGLLTIFFHLAFFHTSAGVRGRSNSFENLFDESDQNVSAEVEVCKPWCKAGKFDSDLGFGVFCSNPKGCQSRTIMYDPMNILKYPTYTHIDGKDYTWQHMQLIRNGLCPKLVDDDNCYVNLPNGRKSNRNQRCGTCAMDLKRGDIYLKALSGGTWDFKSIRNRLNGNRDNIFVYGLSAISHGYTDNTGTRRTFHHKRDMWAEFKRDCGFQCRTASGLKFLPNTFELSNAEDVQAFTQEFKPNTPYLAKNERDAKQGIKLFKAATAKQLLDNMKMESQRLNTDWYVLQEMLDNPALAKVGNSPGFKVNMRTYLILTCSREKREWVMLRAGSHLHYTLAPYTSNIDPSDAQAFKAAVDSSYNVEDLVLKGYIERKDANKWPSSDIGMLENLKDQGWTNDTEAEWKKIEDIFKKGASVYDEIICNKHDNTILDDTGKLFFLIGADILMTGSEVDGHKVLQPYLIEWNTGPAFGDWGRPKDLEHKLLSLTAVLRKGGILHKKPFIPLFTQPEYEHITPDNFEEEGVVWTTVDVKLNPFGIAQNTEQNLDEEEANFLSRFRCCCEGTSLNACLWYQTANLLDSGSCPRVISDSVSVFFKCTTNKWCMPWQKAAIPFQASSCTQTHHRQEGCKILSQDTAHYFSGPKCK